MNTETTMKKHLVVRLPKFVISILSSFIFVIIAETTIAWECPIAIGPSHLEKDLTLASMVVTGSLSDKTVQYIMAMNTVQAESVEITDYARVELWAPIISLKPGFHAKPDLIDGYFRAGIPTFKVNFVNMVDPGTVPVLALDSPSLDNFFNDNNTDPTRIEPDPADHDTFRAFCENEINILNHHFVNEEALPADDVPYREQLIRFRLNQTWAWAPPPVGSDDLEFYNSLTTDPGSWNETFNASSFSTDDAITVVYYRHPDGDLTRTSYWQNNVDGPAPWVLINYRRSDTNLEAPDVGDRNGKGAGNGILDDDDDRTAAHEHEIGHLFQVHHIYDERVLSNVVVPVDPELNRSNIMNTGGSSVRTYEDAYDAANQLCSTGVPPGSPVGEYGDRAEGFWYEPYNGESSGVCQYWNKTCLEYYDDDGTISGDLPVRKLWSQVEIILYSAKHYKETWAD